MGKINVDLSFLVKQALTLTKHYYTNSPIVPLISSQRSHRYDKKFLSYDSTHELKLEKGSDTKPKNKRHLIHLSGVSFYHFSFKIKYTTKPIPLR